MWSKGSPETPEEDNIQNSDVNRRLTELVEKKQLFIVKKKLFPTHVQSGSPRQMLIELLFDFIWRIFPKTFKIVILENLLYPNDDD